MTEDKALFEGAAVFLEKLAGASEVDVIADKSAAPENSVSVVVARAEMLLPLDELVDKEKELERLNKEKAKLEGEIKRVEGKLSNKGFTDQAPDQVVEEERKKGEKYREMLEKVLESIAKM